MIPAEKTIKRKLAGETTEYIPVSEFMKDEHQLGMLHYFNPETSVATLKSQKKLLTNFKMNPLLNQLKMTDDMEKRILRGQIDKLKLERNIRRKRANVRKDMAMYRQGFEN